MGKAATNKSIVNVSSNDIVYGRGNNLKKHSGNINYRSIVQSLKEFYVTFPKYQKKIVGKIIHEKIKSLNPPGRFLVKTNVGKYTELDIKSAIRKINQCLREKQKAFKASTSLDSELVPLTESELEVKIQEMRVCYYCQVDLYV